MAQEETGHSKDCCKKGLATLYGAATRILDPYVQGAMPFAKREPEDDQD